MFGLCIGPYGVNQNNNKMVNVFFHLSPLTNDSHEKSLSSAGDGAGCIGLNSSVGTLCFVKLATV